MSLRYFELDPDCTKCGAGELDVSYTQDGDFIASRHSEEDGDVPWEALALRCGRCGHLSAMETKDSSELRELLEGM